MCNLSLLSSHAFLLPFSNSADFQKVARATAGFTGAELMNLMNQSGDNITNGCLALFNIVAVLVCSVLAQEHSAHVSWL
jgi:hypothetical protein